MTTITRILGEDESPPKEPDILRAKNDKAVYLYHSETAFQNAHYP